MHHLIPVESFECSDLPVLAVDREGSILYSNRAGAQLFAREPDHILGKRCWKLVRLRRADGVKFCRSGCPLLDGRHGRTVRALHPVLLPAGAGTPLRFDLVTFVVPPVPHRSFTLLHFFVPTLSADERPSGPATASPPASDRIHMLTTRELETLGLLAEGLAPAAVAGRMRISLVTVRNHIRSILHKLRLHRQVEAILALVERHGVAHPRIDH